MRKEMRFILLIVVAGLLVGCQGRVFLNLDVPIVIEPARPPYRAETWGYLSYNKRDHHIIYTLGRNTDRSYRPLADAKVTVVGTGLSIHTDSDGYFYLRGVPHGSLSLLVQHKRVGPGSGVYIYTRSR
ncbi:MAG: carboxypeptidase-like regulatory domain-containing protein [Limnochordia bacterium]|nr:carboxypeptidase-like regulatory domain-containing protein [Limnochordia bacterium]